MHLTRVSLPTSIYLSLSHFLASVYLILSLTNTDTLADSRHEEWMSESSLGRLYLNRKTEVTVRWRNAFTFCPLSKSCCYDNRYRVKIIMWNIVKEAVVQPEMGKGLRSRVKEIVWEANFWWSQCCASSREKESKYGSLSAGLSKTTHTWGALSVVNSTPEFIRAPQTYAKQH